MNTLASVPAANLPLVDTMILYSFPKKIVITKPAVDTYVFAYVRNDMESKKSININRRLLSVPVGICM